MKLNLTAFVLMAIMTACPVVARRPSSRPIEANDRCCFSSLPRGWRGSLDHLLDSVRLTERIERYMRRHAPEVVAAALGIDIPDGDANTRRLQDDDMFPEIEIVSIEEVTDGGSSRRKLGRSEIGLDFSPFPRCNVPRFPSLSCELTGDPDDCQSVCDATGSNCGSPECFDVDDFCEALFSVEVTQKIWSCRRCRDRKVERIETIRISGQECVAEGSEGQCCLDIYALAIEAYRYWISFWFGWWLITIEKTRWDVVWEEFANDVPFRIESLQDMLEPDSHIGILDTDGNALTASDLNLGSATDLFELICPEIGGTFCCESNCDAGGGMDPHFKTWAGDWYNFQGACDLTLLKVPEFFLGLGLDIQVRTTGRYEYSYIEDGAIRIGDDVLQVSSFGGYMYNGVSQATMPVMMADKFSVTHTEVSNKEHIFDIEITHKEHIIISTFKDMVNVKMVNATEYLFGNSSGLMGSFKHGTKLGRDGVTVFEDMDAFGQEWQVLESEDSLFATVRAPQHPQTCIMPDPAIADGRRRRLGASVAQEAAEMACDHLEDDSAKDMCVYDVIATRDLEVAKAGAY